MLFSFGDEPPLSVETFINGNLFANLKEKVANNQFARVALAA